jgi:predicted esterase YcpF (UPF0227 family)
MKTKVIYIHGYGSTPDSEKVRELRNHFCTVAPSVPVLYDEAYNVLYHTILDASKEQKTSLILVGISLGGYWATMMGRLFSLPSVIINPSCTPSSTLASYDNPVLTIEELKKYRGLNRTNLGHNPKIVALATDDEVLDHKVAAMMFKKAADVRLFTGPGHRFNDHEIIRSLVDEMKNSLYLP